MSLLRLLTTGKSWIAQTPSGGRYRMSDPGAMPKFGSPKVSNTAAGSEMPRAEACDPEASPAPAPAGDLSSPVAKPVNASKGNLLKPIAGAEMEKGSWAAGLGRKLASFVSRRSRQPAPAAIRRPEKVAVQCELSLDLVKVVRNDLSDADLEIVPAKAPAENKALASVRPEVDGNGADENPRRSAATCLVGAERP